MTFQPNLESRSFRVLSKYVLFEYGIHSWAFGVRGRKPAGSTPMIFQVDLSVQGVGIAVAAPGTLALLMIGGLALGAVSRAGGRRVTKLAENAEGS